MQKLGLPFISSLSQSVKGFDKFCSSQQLPGETREEEDSFVPPEDGDFRNFQPCSSPTHSAAGN